MATTTQSPVRQARKVIIIGGGFAGLECAKALANDQRFEVELYDKQNHHLFQPLLYQVATASLSAPDIARSIRQVLEKARNVTVFMDEVVAIAPETKTISTASGRQCRFDYLVIAAGATTSYFGNEAWAEHSYGLKTLADAQAIRRRVLANLEAAELTDDEAERRRLMTVAIIGGGPTGVELAGAFVDLIRRSLRLDFRRIDTAQIRVVLVENSPRILEHFDEDQSHYAKERLTSLGVEVRNNTRVSNIEAGLVHFNDGSKLEARAIIWAAGVVASPLTRSLGIELERGGRVPARPDLSVPGYPDIFVAGDILALRDEAGKPVPGVAPAAMQMGRHVARVLKEELRLENTRFAERKRELRPAFRYWDKGIMAIVGKNHAVLKSGQLKLTGFAAWLAWLFVHIAFLIGFRNKLAVLLGWAYAYVRDEPDARIIIHPPPWVKA